MTQNIIRAILQTTIYSSILIIAVMSIRAIFSTKIKSKIVSFLWIIVLCRLLLPITIPTSIHLDNIVSPKTEQIERTTIPRKLELAANHEILSTISTESIQSNYVPKVISPPPIVKPVNNLVEKSTPQPKIINIIPILINHKWNILFALWILGVSWVLCLHLYRTFAFSKKINRCRKCRNEKVLSIIQNHSDLLHIKRTIRIVSCPDVNIPVVYGILHPTILLPLHIEKSISDSKLRCILLHEICHIKRDDMLKNYLWLLAKSLYWFNPLVWFAYQNYLDDVEISCDEMVLSYLNSDEKLEYTSSLIDVVRISQYGYKFPLTVSFCNSKSKIRKRVTNMLDPKTKSKKINLLAIILSIVMIIGCFTTACQPTQKKPVGQSKKDDLVKKVLESTEDKTKKTPIIKSTSTPKKPQKVIEQKIIDHIDNELIPNDRVKININADVYMPADVKIPLASIEPANFTKEQFNNFIKYFAGDNPVYYSQGVGHEALNKEEIEAAILELESCLKNKDLKKHVKNDIDDSIDFLKEYYQLSLSKKENRPYESNLAKGETNLANTTVKSFLGKNIAATFQSSSGKRNSMSFSNINYLEPYNYSEPYIGVHAKNIELSYEEAKKMATDAIEALDGKDTTLTLSSSNISYQLDSIKGYTKQTSPQAYSFVFNKNYNGINSKHIHYLWEADDIDDTYWGIDTEAFYITIDDTGIVECNWLNHSELNEIIDDDAELLNFDNVKKLFRNHLKQKFESMPVDDYVKKDAKATIDIKRVELNLVPTTVKGDETYRMIPVWDFIGDITYDKTVSYQDGSAFHPYTPPKNVSILTINAIDGKLVSR